MNIQELHSYILEMANSYKKLEAIEFLSNQLSTNKELLASIKEILSECKTYENLRKKNQICSFCIHVLVRSQRPEGMFILIQYIKSLDTYMPLTYIEFLAKVLSFFGKIIVGPAKELIQYASGSPQRAIGIQVLCNLFLEGLLGDEHLPYLSDLISDFEEDPYFSSYLIEMVKSTREFKEYLKKEKKQTIEEEIEIDSILIEKT